MSAERNKIILYRDWETLLSQFSATNDVNAKIKAALKAAEKQKPFKSTYNKMVNACGFILHRESIVTNRGSSKLDASSKSPVSSAGYVAMVPSLAAKFDALKYMSGGLELEMLWTMAGPWPKRSLACIEIFYKDSALSGIIARRAIDDNHFNDKNLAREAQSRMDKKAPGNPSMINGSSEEYEILPTVKGRFLSPDIAGPSTINF